MGRTKPSCDAKSGMAKSLPHCQLSLETTAVQLKPQGTVKALIRIRDLDALVNVFIFNLIVPGFILLLVVLLRRDCSILIIK